MSVPDPDPADSSSRPHRGWERRVLILAPIAVTVLIAALVGTFVVVQAERQSNQVEQADAVAADYLSAVASFRSGVLTAVKESDQKSPAAIRKALLTAIDEPPALADAETFGEQGSTTYTRAEQMEAGLLEPYESLSRQLKEANVALTYIKAARRVLAMRITDYVSSTTLSSSGELRSSLIPAFVTARDRLATVTVPKGQQELAATVTGAVQYVIDQSTTLADSIDARRTYSFTYSAQFEKAITAVEDYATEITGDLTESLNSLSDLSG